MKKDIAASVRARLLLLAKAEKVDFQYILVRYALERLLYRLGESKHVDHFLLKGALLFSLWYDMPHRATRDADLLGFGSSDLDSVGEIFREIVSIPVEDGIVFAPGSVTVDEIRKESGYAGARVLIDAELAKARCKVQVDIGYGDAVVPGPVMATYPVLIPDQPAPKLYTYPVYTVVSEKVHAIAVLGMTNSRLKDYFDLWVMLDREALNIHTLAQAISATFARRGLAMPDELPAGLTGEFASDVSRLHLWAAFLKKNGLDTPPLEAVVENLRSTLGPVLQMAKSIQLE